MDDVSLERAEKLAELARMWNECFDAELFGAEWIIRMFRENVRRRMREG